MHNSITTLNHYYVMYVGACTIQHSVSKHTWLEIEGTFSLFSEEDVSTPSLGKQQQQIPISQDEGTSN